MFLEKFVIVLEVIRDISAVALIIALVLGIAFVAILAREEYKERAGDEVRQFIAENRAKRMKPSTTFAETPAKHRKARDVVDPLFDELLAEHNSKPINILRDGVRA